MFSGYDVPQSDNADFHVKPQRAATADQESSNIALVQNRPFAPATIACCDDRVYSTRGTPLHTFLFEQASKLEICLAAAAGYRLIGLLHRHGFYHLDAKINNMVAVPGRRPNGVNVALPSGKTYHLCFVDYETLWAPAHMLRPGGTAIFDEDSESLADYGWRPHAEYAGLATAYRYDVHTYSESLRSVCAGDDPRFAELQTAHACVLGHIPDEVRGEDVGGVVRSFTEYLLDPARPVLTPAEAVTVVQAAYFPVELRAVRWHAGPCTCTEAEYCAPCVDRANAALNTQCPFATPDIVGEHDERVRAVLERCLLLCDASCDELRAALAHVGARPGDCARLLGVLGPAL